MIMMYIFFSCFLKYFCFQISGFVDTIGYIDGTYVPIRTPAHKIKNTYVNRHDQPSLVLQGICDYQKK